MSTVQSDYEDEKLEQFDKQTLIQQLMTANRKIIELQGQLTDQTDAINHLTEQLKILKNNQFGRHTERGLSKDIEGQLVFVANAFNELEVEVSGVKEEEHTEPKIESVVKGYTRKKGKPKNKREADLSNIEKVVVEDRLTDEELREAFPDGRWTEMESYHYSRLEMIPASFKVYEHHVFAYKGSDGHIVKAKHEPSLMRNSIATPSLVAAIINAKYVNAMPINRFHAELERREIHISTQDLCYWVNTCAERYFRPLYDRLKEHLVAGHVIHMDETPLEVRKDDRPAGTKSFMWVYHTGEYEPHACVLYDYQKTRNSNHPEEFLKGFTGIGVTDGFSGYQALENRQGDRLQIAGCWVHAKRKFADVVKAKTPGTEGTIAAKAVSLIEDIFHNENALHDLSPEDRLEARRKKIAPLVDAYFAWAREKSTQVSAKSRTGVALSYSLNQEQHLRVFLTDGEVPMSNNEAERSIRMFTVGRKNWYVIDTIKGAQASAVLYSIAETAKQNNLKPYEYFKYCMEQICTHGEFDNPSYLDDLLPWSEKLPPEIRKTPAAASK